MSRLHCVFVVVPGDHADEIAGLDSCARDARRQHAADSHLLGNRACRRAERVAVHHAEIDGEEEASAFAGLAAVIRKAGCVRSGQGIFLPSELSTLTQGLAKLRASLGEDGLIRRIINESLDTSPRAVRRLLAAFEAALSVAAAAPDTALFWSYYVPGAEADYARHQAREAAMEAAVEPLSAEELAAAQAVHRDVLERLDALIAEGDARTLMEEAADDTGLTTWYIALAPEQLEAAGTGELAGPLGYDAELMMAGEVSRAREVRRVAAVRERLCAQAAEAAVLTRYGEVVVSDELRKLIQEAAPGVVQDSGLYTPAQARALQQAVLAVQRGAGGEAGLVRRLAELAYVPRRAYAQRPLRALKRCLRAAGRGQLALLWLRR